MTNVFDPISPRGSMWHRWDPHIHTPGTALNDQYNGADPWQSFLDKVEQSDPPIRALGITDYCSIDGYVQTAERKAKGRLDGVGLIFPNVEFRLSIETNKGAGVNLHLLFSPHDADHVDRIRHFLDGLAFHYQQDTFRCNRTDLIRLGRVHKPSLADDDAALSEGVNQFKLNPNDLRAAWKNSAWVQDNCLIAVAGTGRDGTSGLQGDGGAWEATRKNLEGLAHIIFAANPKQVEFYLGRGAATIEDLEKKWGGRKPCLHGSDAHEADRVGLPDQARRCWLNGDLTFDTLRHAAIEPEGRVHIGEAPPRGALPGNCMQIVRVSEAPWMRPSEVPINGGMVAIIGARGSGKTALADLIATGAFGVSSQLSDSSFLKRAAQFLSKSSVKVTWEAGDDTENAIAAAESEELFDAPHVQYLSQQFVERLCSSEGLNDELIAEIQRVVHAAHPEADRLGAQDFDSLLSLRLEGARDARMRHQRALDRAVEAITAEQLRKDGLKALQKDHDEKKKALDKDIADRKLLVPKGQEHRTKRFEAVAAAAEARQRLVQAARKRLQATAGLQGDVREFREHSAPDWLAVAKERRADAGLTDADWTQFALTFVGDVDKLLTARAQAAHAAIKQLEGPSASDPPVDPKADPAIALIAEHADLSAQSLHLLERERDRLQRLVGVDEQNARRFKQLSEKITKAEAALSKVADDIKRAGKADEMLASLRDQRSEAYRGVFDAVIEEERELGGLYAPLKDRIAAGKGVVTKLAFSVRRVVNIDAWAKQGEALLDLRTGPFRGKGELRQVAETILGTAWREGTAQEVATAMAAFVQEQAKNLTQQKPANVEYRTWTRQISSWLYSTDHLQVSYGLQYDSVEIERLSPGTRGIVLLLLYLAIDAEDDRPLIIDQPEENLDPQSVFAELVPIFREAKSRRQIIIVTHNANLVVNTDVDQVVVARCGPHRAGRLPEITYQSGGLENPAIRGAVCEILEGGERAFRERAKRLRVTL